MENSEHENKKEAFLYNQYKGINLKFEGNFFTPTIEELYVGYELESYSASIDELGKKELNFERWDNCLLTREHLITILKYGTSHIRVPYLAKWQIEKEEGIINEETDSYYYSGTLNNFVFRKNNHWICLSHRDKLPLISIIPIDPAKEEGFWHEVRFIGYCKSINEFRNVLKFLNI